MTLSEKRVLFTQAIAHLIIWAHSKGFFIALDQVKRTQAEADANAKSGAGISNSLHLQGLAADCLLYMRDEDGKYVYKTNSADYKELGEYWETLHPLACWGGRFKKVDGNHFSFEHNGVK